MTRLVYVAGPFSALTRAGVEANIRKAELVGIELARIGAMPVIPHTNTSHPDFENVQGYGFWIDGTLELMRRCDAVIMVSGWEKSHGARAERVEAIQLGIPVFESIDDVARWVRGEVDEGETQAGGAE